MKWLQPLQVFDHLLFHWCMARRHRVLFTALSRAVSKTADGWLYIAFALVFLLADGEGGLPFVQALFAALVLERLVYFVMKNTCRRHRPADAISEFKSFITPSDKFSFPSGHTSAAFLFASMVSVQFPQLTPFMYSWAACVGMSRVFLGVHFPLDTVVGASLGTSIAIFVLKSGWFL